MKTSFVVLTCTLVWSLGASGYGLNDFIPDPDKECIPLQLCPKPTNFLDIKPHASETFKLMKKFHCGYIGDDVWCKISSTCKTPDYLDGNNHRPGVTPGVCVNVEECNSYLHLLEEVDRSNLRVKKYLQEFRCNSDLEDDIKVCCPEAKFSTHFRGFPHADFEERFSARPPVMHISAPKPLLEKCGQHNVDNKILGGAPAGLDEYPWIALLKYETMRGELKFGCAATLITDRYVVTAGHCVDKATLRGKGLKKLSRIILGEYDTRNETDCIYNNYGEDCTDPPQEFSAEEIIVHPNFTKRNVLNDIALIRLDRSVKFTDYIKPICLPPSNFRIGENETLTIAGWGSTETEKESPIKRKGTLKLLQPQQCEKLSRLKLTNGQVCVGEGKSGSCYGDSGGPLMVVSQKNSERAQFIVGIVSYGFNFKSACSTSYPEVYTYVPQYAEWIFENVI